MIEKIKKFLTKNYIYILIVILIINLGSLIIFMMYDQSEILIELNNRPVSFSYNESYHNYLSIFKGEREKNVFSSKKLNYINRMQLEDSFLLKVVINKIPKNNIDRLVIKKENSVFYDGGFREDLSDIINQYGRYYIHLYMTEYTGTLKLTKTKWHFSFNIIIGGDIDE